MPVFSTKVRDVKKLALFAKLFAYVQENSNDISLQAYSYFNGVAVDKQFILETDGTIFYDLDSLLWLQKQYKALPQPLRQKIHEDSKIGDLHNMTLTDLI